MADGSGTKAHNIGASNDLIRAAGETGLSVATLRAITAGLERGAAGAVLRNMVEMSSASPPFRELLRRTAPTAAWQSEGGSVTSTIETLRAMEAREALTRREAKDPADAERLLDPLSAQRRQLEADLIANARPRSRAELTLLLDYVEEKFAKDLSAAAPDADLLARLSRFKLDLRFDERREGA